MPSVIPYKSISSHLEIDHSDAEVVNLNYARNIVTEAVMGSGQPEIVELNFKRNLNSTIKGDRTSITATPTYKRSISASLDIASTNPVLYPNFKRAIASPLSVGGSNPALMPSVKRAIAAELKIDHSDTHLTMVGIKRAIAADIEIDQSNTQLTGFSRKFLFPPPTASIVRQTAGNNEPLQGSQMYAGDSEAFNITLRGYHLDALQSGTGAYILFTVKKSPTSADIEAVFQKASKPPISGISILSVTDIGLTDIGTLQELKGQIRVYPNNTQGKYGTMYYEMEIIDPLSEVITFAPGSFSLLRGVRNG